MAHATLMFDLDRDGEDQLAVALRNLPVGASLRLVGSGLGVTRVGGGRTFRPVVPPRVTKPVGWRLEDFKSVKTAAPALAAAHSEAKEQLK